MSFVKMPAGLISDESPLPGLSFSLCPHLAFSPCECGQRALVTLRKHQAIRLGLHTFDLI